MKSQSIWKSRRDRQIVTLEAYDADNAVYRIKSGNKLTELSIVSVSDFLKKFMEIENEASI